MSSSCARWCSQPARSSSTIARSSSVSGISCRSRRGCAWLSRSRSFAACMGATPRPPGAGARAAPQARPDRAGGPPCTTLPWGGGVGSRVWTVPGPRCAVGAPYRSRPHVPSSEGRHPRRPPGTTPQPARARVGVASCPPTGGSQARGGEGGPRRPPRPPPGGSRSGESARGGRPSAGSLPGGRSPAPPRATVAQRSSTPSQERWTEWTRWTRFPPNSFQGVPAPAGDAAGAGAGADAGWAEHPVNASSSAPAAAGGDRGGGGPGRRGLGASSAAAQGDGGVRPAAGSAWARGGGVGDPLPGCLTGHHATTMSHGHDRAGRQRLPASAAAAPARRTRPRASWGLVGRAAYPFRVAPAGHEPVGSGLPADPGWQVHVTVSPRAQPGVAEHCWSSGGQPDQIATAATGNVEHRQGLLVTSSEAWRGRRSRRAPPLGRAAPRCGLRVCPPHSSPPGAPTAPRPADGLS